MSLLVETTTRDAASLVGPRRDVVAGLDQSQPVVNVRTMAGFYEQRAIGVLTRSARAAGAMGLIGLPCARRALWVGLVFSDASYA